MEADRVLDAVEAVERVSAGCAYGIIRPSGSMPARPAASRSSISSCSIRWPLRFALDRRDVADQPACRKADPDIVDVQPRDAFGLLDRLAHDMLGLFHVGDIAALHTAAFALAGTEHVELAVGGLPRDQRAHTFHDPTSSAVMIFSMRAVAAWLTLLRRALPRRRHRPRRARPSSLAGATCPLVRQTQHETVGVAHVEAQDAAAKQAVGAVHMRELGERGLRLGLALGERQRLAAAEAEVPAAVADPRSRPRSNSRGCSPRRAGGRGPANAGSPSAR